MLSTHLQAFFVDGDHHPGVLTLHTEANTLNALMLLGLSVAPRPVVECGGHGWREGKGQVGAPRDSSRMSTRVTQDGELWRERALQRIHQICKLHMVRISQG